MSVEQTLSIIKPDAVAKNVTGQINARFEAAGLQIVAQKMLRLSDDVAGGFYAEHKERPFYADLVAFMTSGPVVVQVLEGEGAILKNRSSWVLPTQLKRTLVLSVPTLRIQSTQTQSTALTHPRLQRAKSPISLLQAISAVANSELRCRKR